MMVQTGGIKKEEGERSYKDVKNEDESMGGGVELAAEAKTAKTKKNAVEIGESSRGAALRNKKAEKIKKKKAVPKFKITIKKSYLKILVKTNTKNTQQPYYIVSTLVDHVNLCCCCCCCFARESQRIFMRSTSRMGLWCTRYVTPKERVHGRCFAWGGRLKQSSQVDGVNWHESTHYRLVIGVPFVSSNLPSSSSPPGRPKRRSL